LTVLGFSRALETSPVSVFPADRDAVLICSSRQKKGPRFNACWLAAPYPGSSRGDGTSFLKLSRGMPGWKRRQRLFIDDLPYLLLPWDMGVVDMVLGSRFVMAGYQRGFSWTRVV
jgi:hypothetical protein